MRRLVAIAALALMPFGAQANDTMVELQTGGLEYVRSDAVEIVREDLFISMDEIRVDYVFKNTTDADVESLVAFPMPPIASNAYEPTDVPVQDTNFLGFRVFVDGDEIFPELSQRATAMGVDVTDDLLDARVQLVPALQAATDELENLPQPIAEDWEARGILTAERWDTGEGMQTVLFPHWVLDQTYYWRMRFPAGQQINVSHTYTPSVGGTTSVMFLDWDGNRSDFFAEYEEKYCIDPSFVNAVKKRVTPDSGIAMFESWISYILTTGRNWYGPIGTFHLTIDKGATDNLVSFCGTGVTKTAPTQFELTYTDYYPDKELDVLILEPVSW